MEHVVAASEGVRRRRGDSRHLAEIPNSKKVRTLLSEGDTLADLTRSPPGKAASGIVELQGDGMGNAPARLYLGGLHIVSSAMCWEFPKPDFHAIALKCLHCPKLIGISP